MSNSIKAFKERVRKAYKEELIEGSVRTRLCTGSYDLDRALGGGMLRGRFHLWIGKESTGKTSLSVHAMREANHMNWSTGEYDPTLKEPSPVLFVDVEGTFDEGWAENIGVPYESFDDYNWVVRPTTGEMAADIVLNGIESGDFGLIIVDSNEAFVAMETIGKPLEQVVMCDRAKILSRMYRTGQAHLNRGVNKEQPWRTPTVLCLNQLRDQIGKSGPTAPLPPGGIAQRQYSSTIVQFNAPFVRDDSAKSYGVGEFKGVVKKNKTGPPKKAFKYEMAIRDLRDGDGSGLAAGQIDNAKSISNDIKDLGMMVETKKGWEVNGVEYRIQADFKNALATDPMALRKIWQELLEKDRS